MVSGELSPKLRELAVISEVIEEDDFEMSEKRYSRVIFSFDTTQTAIHKST
jgi:hypothetical protein